MNTDRVDALSADTTADRLGKHRVAVLAPMGAPGLHWWQIMLLASLMGPLAIFTMFGGILTDNSLVQALARIPAVFRVAVWVAVNLTLGVRIRSWRWPIWCAVTSIVGIFIIGVVDAALALAGDPFVLGAFAERAAWTFVYALAIFGFIIVLPMLFVALAGTAIGKMRAAQS